MHRGLAHCFLWGQQKPVTGQSLRQQREGVPELLPAGASGHQPYFTHTLSEAGRDLVAVTDGGRTEAESFQTITLHPVLMVFYQMLQLHFLKTVSPGLDHEPD